MQVPSVINDPDFGQITVLSSVSYQGRNFVQFVNSSGQLCQGVFDDNDNALGQPVRFSITSGGLIAADFPGVDPNVFATNGDHGGPGSITNG